MSSELRKFIQSRSAIQISFAGAKPFVLYFGKIWGLRALSGFYIVSPKDVGEVIDPFEKISQNIEGLEML